MGLRVVSTSGSLEESSAVSSGSWTSSEGVQRSMRSNRGRDTSPEMAVRRAVWARGMRYWVDTRPLPELNRRADLVFRRERVAVFVDGCYWHSCPVHATRPSTNSDFWTRKLENTIARDRDTNEQLRAHGWTVLRFWEHEDAAEVADAVERIVQGHSTRTG